MELAEHIAQLNAAMPKDYMPAVPADFAAAVKNKRTVDGLLGAVNDELAGLERALPDLRDRLTPGGVLAIISYHSGEDRLVKNAFRDWSTACTCPPRLMMCACRGVPLGETLTRKPVSATDEEVDGNTRARSARLRAWRLSR
jgi:16S rRNA (cytosine1402-N4)-methyltransferase